MNPGKINQGWAGVGGAGYKSGENDIDTQTVYNPRGWIPRDFSKEKDFDVLKRLIFNAGRATVALAHQYINI